MDEFRKLKGLEALASLLSHQPGPPDADSAFTPEDVASATYAVDSLVGSELIYYFCKSLNMDVIGDPSSVFAAFHQPTGALTVFAPDVELVDIDVFPYVNVKIAALEGALKREATFHTCDGQPTCVSGGFPAHGADFADASMRARLKQSINRR